MWDRTLGCGPHKPGNSQALIRQVVNIFGPSLLTELWVWLLEQTEKQPSVLGGGPGRQLAPHSTTHQQGDLSVVSCKIRENNRLGEILCAECLAYRSPLNIRFLSPCLCHIHAEPDSLAVQCSRLTSGTQSRQQTVSKSMKWTVFSLKKFYLVFQCIKNIFNCHIANLKTNKQTWDPRKSL